jgi:monofunctional glycosyltransferase
VLLTLAPVAALRWVTPPTTSFMLQSPVRPVHHRWVEAAAIPPHLRLAVVAAEDQRFPHHRGFDVDAMADAWAEFRGGGRRRGASTISQQLAKNLFLWPGGGYARKGIEAGYTVLIETLWPKGRILEVYLNVAEFGPGVYGVGAAAEHFFGKPVQRLSRREAALLAAVLPSPRRMSPAQPSAQVLRRADWIQVQMRQLGDAWLDGI